jgi:hypothetical protein
MMSPSRVFEKHMYNRLRRHLNDYNVLVEEQFEFKKNLTTKKANYEYLIRCKSF